MAFQLIQEKGQTFNTNIKVIGVGGGGGNAVEHMIDKEAKGITFIAANTDQQVLSSSRADVVIPLGKTGLGAGAKPEVGEKAAKEASEEIRAALEGTHLLFITAGMGGGTGTGAAPVIAEIAREMDILTVAVVTKPFYFEGAKRMRQAQAGIENLMDKVDSLIVILNDRLISEVGPDATMVECFAAADDVLYKACNGIAEIIHTPGVINVDFQDLRTVMGERGMAMMGMGNASGPTRAVDAATKAISCPLLEGANLQGARGLLVFVTASAESMRMNEVEKVMGVMNNFVSPDDQLVIYGTAYDNTLGDEMRVTVVATGLDKIDGMSFSPSKKPASNPDDIWGLGSSSTTSNIFTSRTVSEPAAAPKAEPVTPITEVQTKPELPPLETFAPVSADTRKDEENKSAVADVNVFDVPTFMRRK